MNSKKLFFFLLITFFTLYCNSCSSSSSNTIYGEWVEYRADDPTDTYLLSHIEFKSDGTGAFWLTDAGRIRTKYEFIWNDNGYGNVTTQSLLDGSISKFSYNNGLVVENSAMGGIVYKKR